MVIQVPYLAPKAVDLARSFLNRELGYDFLGLLVKLAVYFVAAWVLDLYIKAVAGQQNWISRLLGTFGGVGGFFISGSIIDYFTKPEQAKIPYWQIIKIIAVFMVVLEAKNYYELNESTGRKPSPFTLGIFGLIVAILGFWTFPDLLKKLQEGNLLRGIPR